MKGIPLNRSFQINSINVHNILNKKQRKDEFLFSRKTFLEIILGIIKKSLIDLLSKNESKEKEGEISKIKRNLIKLKESLNEIKEEKEKKMKVYLIQKKEKQLYLNDLMINKNIYKRRRINSEILLTLNSNELEDINYDYIKKEDKDIKIKNFILENQIIEIDNLIKRYNYLIKFDRNPHRFQDHIIENIVNNKKNNNYITDNLNYKLLTIRGKWKDIANKKNIQEENLENVQSKINDLKKKNEKQCSKNKKYIDTEDIIPEENLNTENNQEDINKKNENHIIKNSDGNIEVHISNKDLDKLKIDFKDIEKLMKLKMNINVNINLNKQYIHNHFNQIDSVFISENIKNKNNNDNNNEHVNMNTKN